MTPANLETLARQGVTCLPELIEGDVERLVSSLRLRTSKMWGGGSEGSPVWSDAEVGGSAVGINSDWSVVALGFEPRFRTVRLLLPTGVIPLIKPVLLCGLYWSSPLSVTF